MNIRLKGNALRLRVTQSALDRFRTTGRIERVTRFGPNAALTCVLATDADADTPTAHFDGQHLTVRLPEALARTWITTDRVGFETEQPTGKGTTLHLTVEKDFGCRHQNDPDIEDKFTHLSKKEPPET